jgi:hypothetical protein
MMYGDEFKRFSRSTKGTMPNSFAVTAKGKSLKQAIFVIKRYDEFSR